jgi:hypothetical protein
LNTNRTAILSIDLIIEKIAGVDLSRLFALVNGDNIEAGRFAG